MVGGCRTPGIRVSQTADCGSRLAPIGPGRPNEDEAAGQAEGITVGSGAPPASTVPCSGGTRETRQTVSSGTSRPPAGQGGQESDVVMVHAPTSL
nr:hypothetical protein GCM10010200_040340 [Actinomadura rugatobispora]